MFKIKKDDVVAKIKQTCQEKYGVENPLQLQSAKTARDAAAHNRRGIPQTNVHRDAIKRGLIAKYGVENPSQIPSVRIKITETMNERYGGYYVASNEMQRQKHQSWLKRKLDLLKSVYETELVGEYQGSKKIHDGRCLVCNTVFPLSIADGKVSRCPRCYFSPANRSMKEAELSEYIAGFGEPVLTNVRSKELIYPYSLDIWVPSKSIAVEFNGDYWHQESHRGDKYHLMKLELCRSAGIQLIQIFEHEWDNQRDLIKSRLASVFDQNTERVFARECEVVTVSTAEERSFLNANHLQGYVPSARKLGLSHRGRLVMLMTVGKPRFSKHHDVELLRVVSINGVFVVGGASKLLKHLDLRGKIISYRDRRWGESNFYPQLGFKLIRVSAPSYVYVKHGIVVPRYQVQKKVLPNLLGDLYDDTLTESENMAKARFMKLWDCGQEVYEINILE